MIANALFLLMKRKPFVQITITEICEEAGIGRKTFYRNFEIKEDVIDFKLDLMIEQYKKEIRNISYEEMLRHHFDFLKRHTGLLTILYCNGMHQTSVSKFSALLPYTMPKWTDDPLEQQYRSEYIVAGIEAIGRLWITRGFKESVDEIVQIATQILS